MSRITSQACRGCSVILFAVILPVCGLAQEPVQEAAPPQWQRAGPSLELSLSVAHTDNIFREALNKQSDTIASAGLGVNLARDRERLKARALGNLGWYDYLDNSYESEVLGYFNGWADLELIADRLDWQFLESFGQLVTDPFQAQTPDNLENVNYFTTGPTLTLRTGATTLLQLNGTFSSTDYEESQSDNDQLAGTIALVRQVSSRSNVSMNASYADVRFDDRLINTDYTVKAAYAGFLAQSFRTQLSAKLGYSKLEREGVPSTGGAFVQIVASRRLSPSANAFLSVRQQYSNAAAALREGLDSSTGVPRTGIATADVFRERGVSLGWSYERARTAVGIAADWTKEAYEEPGDLDRRIRRMDVYFTRRLRPTVSWRLDARQERSRYPASAFEDDQINAGTSLAWQAGRQVVVEMRYDWFDRNTAGAGALVGDAGEYSESRYTFRVSYRPVGN